MSDMSLHYRVNINSQIHQLQHVLAQDNIMVSERTIETAFKMPTFDWRDVAVDGKPVYNNRGAYLMVNPFPKVKKGKKKGKKKK